VDADDDISKSSGLEALWPSMRARIWRKQFEDRTGAIAKSYSRELAARRVIRR
jgi:hypothetical protein